MSPESQSGRLPRSGVFSAALEVMPDIVLVHDAERILFANAACRRYLGAERPEDLEGRPVDVIVHPDGYAAGRERREVLIQGQNALRDIPLKLVSLTGETLHVSVNAWPIVLADGYRAAVVVARPPAP